MSARLSRLALLAYALLGAMACSFDDDANAANGCDPSCADCYMGFCLSMRDDGIGGGGSGATSGASGVGGTNGGSGGITSGGTGGAGTGGIGGAGTGGAGGAGSGGVGGGGTGGAGGAGGAPGCGQGMSAAPETCNGLDDDCDGDVDEDTTVECYPDASGCTENSDGSFECEGVCTSGMRTCTSGTLSACTGAVTPDDEICGGAEAADEDCDGVIDDGCTCDENETQRCYSGPRFTAGVGECEAGVQACVNGRFGDCEGEVTPVPETCGNPDEDNNCNGTDDDVPNEGTICFDFSQEGLCAFGVWWCAGDALVCRTNEAEDTETACDGRDEDCDGDVDETYMFGSDENNCGMCGMRCAEGDLCCSGMCKDIDTDAAHCGGCGETCELTCCAGDCVDTNTTDYCLACDVQCEPGFGCCEEGCAPLDTVQHCGDCETQCEPGFGCCAEGCARLDTVQHCGDCETSCSDGQVCVDGGCVMEDDVPCEAGGAYCPPGPCNFCVESECQDAMGNVCL